MKRTILALLPFTYAISAMACPALTGHYQCKNTFPTNYPPFVMHIQQTVDSIQWSEGTKGDVQGPFLIESAITSYFNMAPVAISVACNDEAKVLGLIGQSMDPSAQTVLTMTIKQVPGGLEITHRDLRSGLSEGVCTKME